MIWYKITYKSFYVIKYNQLCLNVLSLIDT